MADAYRKKMADAQSRAQQEAQIKAVLRTLLEPAAYERLNNIKLSSPPVYSQVVQIIVYLYQNKQLPQKVSEEWLKGVVAKILSQKRETTIRRI